MGLIGSGVADGCKFLVMERLASTLAESLAQPHHALLCPRAKAQQWPLHRAIATAAELARALRYIHDEAYPDHEVLHRDLKPDNSGFGIDGRVLLFDFGLAKLLPRANDADDAAAPMTGKTGSARYMAPEVALSQPYNGKADVHSFGMILYQMAAHEKPFAGMDLEMLYADVVHGGKRPRIPKQWPACVRSLLVECWHPDPSRRPGFREVLRRIEAMLSELPENTDKRTPRPRADRTESV